jgi:hypothetical protein
MAAINLDAITESIYRSTDIIASEPVGLTTSVTLNLGADGISTGGTIDSLRIPSLTVNESDAESMTLPSGDAATVTKETLTLSYTANVKVEMSGDGWTKVSNVGQGSTYMNDIFAQAIRGLRNKIETKACGIVYKYASRAVGTAGTTPFASNHHILNSARQILEDNGMPVDDGQCSAIISTSAGTNLRNLSPLYKVNESGNDSLLRRGTLLDIAGFMVKTSAGIASHTAGAGTGYDLAGSEAIGQTTLSVEGGTVNTTGIAAGDIIALDTDTANNYVVTTGTTSTSGDIVIGAPGLRVAGTTSSEITIGGSYTANLAVHRAAVEIAIRPPAMPPGGDAGIVLAEVFDPKSGIVFTAIMYKGKRVNTINITCHYGVKVWKQEGVAIIRG